MASSSSTIRYLHIRQRHENRRGANPWRTATAPRQSAGPWNQPKVNSEVVTTRDTSDTTCVELPQDTSNGSISLGDAFALLTLLATAVAVLSVTIYGAYYVLSEISTYSTLDVLRMFGGMP